MRCDRWVAPMIECAMRWVRNPRPLLAPGHFPGSLRRGARAFIPRAFIPRMAELNSSRFTCSRWFPPPPRSRELPQCFQTRLRVCGNTALRHSARSAGAPPPAVWNRTSVTARLRSSPARAPGVAAAHARPRLRFK